MVSKQTSATTFGRLGFDYASGFRVRVIFFSGGLGVEGLGCRVKGFGFRGLEFRA